MMIKINCTNRFNQQNTNNEQGFSLIETMIALTTLGVCLAYAMPLFLYAKINNSKSEIRSGALFVAQRVFDNIRSKPFSEMPITDGLYDSNLTGCTNLPALTNCQNAATLPNPEITPNVTNIATSTISGAEKLLTSAFGRQYQTKVTYCEGLKGKAAVDGSAGPPVVLPVPAVPPDPTVCSGKYRKFKVEVSYNGSKVYDLEGTYTDFQ
jgi:prepilin-type N-terminal cleavage/methylation domain-containing protein